MQKMAKKEKIIWFKYICIKPHVFNGYKLVQKLKNK